MLLNSTRLKSRRKSMDVERRGCSSLELRYSWINLPREAPQVAASSHARVV